MFHGMNDSHGCHIAMTSLHVIEIHKDAGLMVLWEFKLYIYILITGTVFHWDVLFRI